MIDINILEFCAAEWCGGRILWITNVNSDLDLCIYIVDGTAWFFYDERTIERHKTAIYTYTWYIDFASQHEILLCVARITLARGGHSTTMMWSRAAIWWTAALYTHLGRRPRKMKVFSRLRPRYSSYIRLVRSHLQFIPSRKARAPRIDHSTHTHTHTRRHTTRATLRVVCVII